MLKRRFEIPAVAQGLYVRHARRLPAAAEWLLTVLLAHAAALLLWQLIPPPADSARVLSASPPPLESARGVNVETIAAAHLFGEYRAPADPALTQLASAPDTRLDLSLLGILAATTERGSRALIAASGGEEKPYAIGDDVVSGASLQAIFPDRVILSRAGQLETLRLNKDAPSSGAAPGAYAAEAAPSGAATETAAMLSSIREQILSDPSRASEYIRVQPASSGGQLRGYRLYPGRDRAVFAAAGLRAGDLVMQVNGIQLNDAATALQMLNQLSQAGSVTVVVERGGQQQTLNLNFN